MALPPNLPVVFLFGGVTPVAASYAPLLEELGPDIELLLKELEIYAADEPPAGYSIQTKVDGLLRTVDAAGRAIPPAKLRMVEAPVEAHAPRTAMKWVTREHPKTDRIACPWLIRKFIDPDAEIVYVPKEDVPPYAEREGAMSFDAPGAEYTHRDGLCSFETLIAEYKIEDPALGLLARVVHGADVREDADATPQSPGLEAIADGFALLELDDQEQLALELPVYDALYAWAQQQVASGTAG